MDGDGFRLIKSKKAIYLIFLIEFLFISGYTSIGGVSYAY